MTFSRSVVVALALLTPSLRAAEASATPPPAPAPHAVSKDDALAAALAKVLQAAAQAQEKIHGVNHLRPEEKELLREDLAFAADAGARGAPLAFSSRFHSQGKMFPIGAPVVFGPGGASALLANDTGKWAWAPLDVVASGDTGTTWGIAVIAFKDEKGENAFLQTRYVTVWRKEGDVWKIWADIGNRGPAPEAR